MSVPFPSLQVAFDKFASPELLNFLRRWDIDLDGVDIDSLKVRSAMIQNFYDEAEMTQFTNGAVKSWLDIVKQLLYEVDDTLDEYITDLLRLKLESESHQTQLVRNLVPLTTPSDTSSSSSSSSSISSLLNSATEKFGLKVKDFNKKLKGLAKEGATLGLISSMGSGSSRTKVFNERPQTSSLVNTSEVFGRDDDKWKIIKWLLSDKTASANNNDNNFSVLPIVGMGGAGKTTLAQLVYNDERVESHFGLKAWVCVSEDFDEVRLTKEILESATGSSPLSNSLDLLQRKLKEALRGKRFLLVVDDMWNKNYERWNALRTPFGFGKLGSKILVTTRNKVVSSIVRTDPNSHDHDLKGLSDEACLDLVRRHAFMDGHSSDANQKLKAFGQKLVKKCKGLPLAVKTLAGLLRDKRENYEWEEILDNEIWDLSESEILPSLMLSYHHLSPLLKRCFQYCALFPKDYVFHKIELVMLWMAEGIVQPKPKEKKRLEEIGAGYFDELFMRSFFDISNHSTPLHGRYLVRPTYPYYVAEVLFYDLEHEFLTTSFFESSSGNMGSGFVMHDLIHDLAQLLSNGTHCRREKYDNKSSEVLTTTRHLSYNLEGKRNDEGIESKAMTSLRTLLDLRNFDRSVFPAMQFQFLRVLRVRNCSNHELPDSIGTLKHLRLLDLSFFNNIVRLPDSVTSLYNLQTLILLGCSRLKQLPEDMGNLVNLRHLLLPIQSLLEADANKMPLLMGVGNLTCLQTLTQFNVGSKNGSELRDLCQLRGTLHIAILDSIGTEAMVANLKNKPHILGLHLTWSRYESKDSFPDLGRDEKVEEDVLDQLQPHTNLKALCIVHYGGIRFPRWMEHPSFSNLEVMILINCFKCKFLPQLQQLPLLKHLEINGCSATKLVRSELYVDGSSSSLINRQFPSLVELKIRNFPDLRELPLWLLPSLRKLSINDCPKLVLLPSLPSVESLTLYSCEHITTLSYSDHPSSSSATSATSTPCVHYSFHGILPLLESLDIEDCKELCFPPMLPSIKELRLKKCKGMMALNNKIMPHLSSLSSLTIKDVSDLKSLSNGFMQHLTALHELKIYYCGDLMVLLQNDIGFDPLPSSLQHLDIRNCENAGKLPQSMCNLHCLQELIIARVRGLTSLSNGLYNLKSLRVLRISNCENLESLPKELHTITSLLEFLIESCPALVSFQEIMLPTGLQKLEIRDCKNLESLPKELHTLTSLQEFVINSCPTLVSFQEIVLPTGLQKLQIINCKNAESLPKELHTLTSLQEFEIIRCPALVSFLEIVLPTALLKLGVINCKNLESLPKELHTVTSLQEFVIHNCPTLVSLQEIELPTALLKLEVKDCKNLESLHKEIHTLMSLQEFVIDNCLALVSFQETVLPTTLQKLSILNCGKLNFSPKELHKLKNLKHLGLDCSSLMDYKNQESLLYLGLYNLTSLTSLSIGKCPILVSIPKGSLPTNLRFFYIYDCPILEFLHEGLCDLTSIIYLNIRNCPILTQRCPMKEREEWIKIISQIPEVRIDGERNGNKA